MNKVIAAINMTLDGVFDHTAVQASEALHQHYFELIDPADVILYGRITYQLMEYWKTVVAHPTGNKATDAFAVSMDKIEKIVFSRTLNSSNWDTATIADETPEKVVSRLKMQQASTVLIGSRSLLIQLMKFNLVDEFQLCIHPVVAGRGAFLFEQQDWRQSFRLIKTKTLDSGAIVVYYQPL
ncbi:dihydrofolate reductase family protein [Flavihumibacter cheonanensis]|uniref:dihydrofolate reductase family protein n=1 Tax=Flavihumibacter cheonanensis TaxID=1442385 RepID=UPI001EF8F68E|nr:dihydrofolate reductase family protein [Flavihumibacter cheonanensis]MCG7750958.1 dihydrofolate reductase family protein [Flavihumibacter cheonanensis]